MATDLTVEKVRGAVMALFREGIYPSQAKIRARLGTTASEQTLSRVVRETYQEIGSLEDEADANGLPRFVVEAAKKAYSDIKAGGEQELEKARAALRDRAAALEAERDTATARANEAEENVGYLQERLEQASTTLAETTAELEKLRGEHRDLDDRFSRLSDELAGSRREAAGAIRSLRASSRRQLQAAADRETALQDKLAQLERSAEAERDRLMVALDEARQETKAERSALESQREEFEAVITQRGVQLADSQATAGRLKAELADETRAREHCEAANRRQESELKTQRDQNDRAQQQVAELQAESSRFASIESTLQQQLEVAQARADERRETIEALRARIDDEAGRRE